MKDTPLQRKLKKKRNKYFRELGVVKKGRKSRKTIEYIVERSYEALPKKYKDFVDEPEHTIKIITNIILMEGDNVKMNPYQALLSTATTHRRHAGQGTRDLVYKRFKDEATDVYNKYNTYVYRLGYSSRNWFYDNFELSQETDSRAVVTIELPFKAKGLVYEILSIYFDWSDVTYFEAEMI